VSDDTPTLAQPTATVTKARGVHPVLDRGRQDWGALESEMAKLIQDAKDTRGGHGLRHRRRHGVNPQGVLTGATGTVAAGTAAFAVAHAYALLEALPPRFRPNATFVANLVQYNRIRQLDTAGGASLWVQNLRQGGVGTTRPARRRSFLGKPAYESSVMSSVLTATAKLMIFGDFRYFLIVDRIGMTVEVVPHLFGSTNQRPIGSRGLLAYWRNTSRVLSTAAFKTLVTTLHQLSRSGGRVPRRPLAASPHRGIEVTHHQRRPPMADSKDSKAAASAESPAPKNPSRVAGPEHPGRAGGGSRPDEGGRDVRGCSRTRTHDKSGAAAERPEGRQGGPGGRRAGRRRDRRGQAVGPLRRRASVPPPPSIPSERGSRCLEVSRIPLTCTSPASRSWLVWVMRRFG
jgi:hypothetical protein